MEIKGLSEAKIDKLVEASRNACPNFGIQEWCRSPELVYEMFPGTPEVRNGYMYPNDKPGLGVEIDEKLAAKYPVEDWVEQWTQTRLPDGSPSRP